MTSKQGAKKRKSSRAKSKPKNKAAAKSAASRNGNRSRTRVVRRVYDRVEDRAQKAAAFVSRVVQGSRKKVVQAASYIRSPRRFRDSSVIPSLPWRILNFLLFGGTIGLAYLVGVWLMPSWLAAFIVATIVVHELGHFVTARRNGYWSYWPIFIPLGVLTFGFTYAPSTFEMSPAQASEFFMAGPAYGLVFVLAAAGFAWWLRIAPLAWASAYLAGSNIWSATFGADGRKHRFHKNRDNGSLIAASTEEEFPVGEVRVLQIAGLEGVACENLGGGSFEFQDLSAEQRSALKDSIVHGKLHVHIESEKENSIIVREWASQLQEVSTE